MCNLFFIFFFQAEDGIRDTSVTGVQTCALPICRNAASRRICSLLLVEYELWSPDWEAKVKASKFADWPHYGRARKGHIALRSEERRVGKECRCSRATSCYKKGMKWGTMVV